MAARTRTYADLLERYRTLCGVDSLSTDETTLAQSYFGRNLKYAWESYPWPSVCYTEDRTADASNVIEWEQAGETEIGEVFACYDANPLTSTGAHEVPYTLTADGILLLGSTIYNPTYVCFRKQCPAPTSGTWSATTIPYELFEYIAQASYGDWLITNEQAQTGLVMRAQADEALRFEMDKLSRQQVFRPHRRTFYTHGTEQLRQ